MSGLSDSARPRAEGSRPRPPVENCTIIPGSAGAPPPGPGANSVGIRGRALVGVAHVDVHEASRRPRTPACVDSICSGGVTGRAGLSFLRGTEPVIATAMTTGLMAPSLGLLVRDQHIGPGIQIQPEMRRAERRLRSGGVPPPKRRTGRAPSGRGDRNLYTDRGGASRNLNLRRQASDPAGCADRNACSRTDRRRCRSPQARRARPPRRAHGAPPRSSRPARSADEW